MLKLFFKLNKKLAIIKTILPNPVTIKVNIY